MGWGVEDGKHFKDFLCVCGNIHTSLSSFCFGQINCVLQKSSSPAPGTFLVELEKLWKTERTTVALRVFETCGKRIEWKLILKCQWVERTNLWGDSGIVISKEVSRIKIWNPCRKSEEVRRSFIVPMNKYSWRISCVKDKMLGSLVKRWRHGFWLKRKQCSLVGRFPVSSK